MKGDSRELLAIVNRARELVKQGNRLNEANTKAVLVEPLLEWLGWDTLNPNEVVREWRRRTKDEPVDYALMGDDRQILLLEAKPLHDRLETDKGWKQIVANGLTANFRWCARTNGHRVMLLNLLYEAPLEHKVFFDIDLYTVDETEGMSCEKVANLLRLLSKEALTSRQTEQAWDKHQMLHRAQTAVGSFFGNPPTGLLDMIRDCAGDPAIPDDVIVSCIEEYLGKRLKFSGESRPEAPCAPRGARQRVTIAELIAAGLVEAGDRWFMQYKGRETAAEVSPDGSLRVDGHEYRSPSDAGRKLTGWTSCDGWRLWRYRDDEGAFRPVDELRQKLLTAKPRESHNEAAPARVREDAGRLESLLARRPHSRAMLDALLSHTRQTVGDFTISANAKHIVFRNKVAFIAISVLAKGLRLGLRLEAAEAERHTRLKVQPKGVFEGWSALHVSTTITDPREVDDELMGLIRQAFRAAS